MTHNLAFSVCIILSLEMEKVSTFETLPDEMILHVCQYRRGGEILHSFFNLNSHLNSTITNFCHYVNLTNLTYQQFKFVALQIVLQISGSIRSFVFNARWESIMFNQQSSIFSFKIISYMYFHNCIH
ncbi:unnamed protein product [Rotaria magnacalcarata]